MKASIIWTGEKDDLTAVVGKYTLRVEQMNRLNWWWAVYFDGFEIDGSFIGYLSGAKREAIHSMKRWDKLPKSKL